ncbi:MAG: hypothetical protein ACLVB1_04835 [Blautia obeum]
MNIVFMWMWVCGFRYHMETVVYYPEPVYMYRLAQETQSVSIRESKTYTRSYPCDFHLSNFLKNTGKMQEIQKTAYIADGSQMIGDQVTIFELSGGKPEHETVSEFDGQLRKTSKRSMSCPEEKVGHFAFEKNGSRGHHPKLARKRNNMEE